MEKLLIVLGAIFLVVIMSLLMAFPTMWLWNYVIPSIFGLVKINFWKALALNLLSGILFKNTVNNSK